MEGRQKSAASRIRPVGFGVLALALLATALVVVSASSGGTDKKQAAAAEALSELTLPCMGMRTRTCAARNASSVRPNFSVPTAIATAPVRSASV